MSAEDDARARREAWVAAGAPDYNAPIKDSGRQVVGYRSVTETPPEQRSESNQGLPYTPTDYSAALKKAGADQPALYELLSAQPQPVSSGEPVAIDGQRFSDQPTAIQDLFRRVHGARAAEVWVIEHNQAVLSDQNDVTQGGTETVGGGSGSSTTGGGTGTTGTGSGATGTDTTGTETDTPGGATAAAAGLWSQAQAWIKAHPVEATALALAAGAIFLGGGGRRRR